MIRVNAFFLVEKSDNKQPLIDAAVELVEISRNDHGCVAYDLFTSQTIDKHLMICETWRSKEDLENHMNSDHFKRIVPTLQKLATMSIEEFNF
jgi:quinol monooxygenase YgiN